MPRWFPLPPVAVINWAKPGIIRQVNSVEDTVKELGKWEKGGRKFTKALKIYADALNDKATPEEAKKVFEAAAEEAKVWVPNREC